MQIPDVTCSKEAYCSINPSEDPKKVEQALSNILSDIDIKINQESLKANSKNLESLTRIFETIHSRKSQNNFKRQLKHNLIDDSTWFYLNKQAAFANVVALCSEADESPLGPIKVIFRSQNIERVIE